MKKVEAPRSWWIDAAPHLTMADFTKVLVTNVALAIAVLVFVFDAPILHTALGAAGAGAFIWLRARRTRARR